MHQQFTQPRTGRTHQFRVNRNGLFVVAGRQWSTQALAALGWYPAPTAAALQRQQTRLEFGNPEKFEGYFKSGHANRQRNRK